MTTTGSTSRSRRCHSTDNHGRLRLSSEKIQSYIPHPEAILRGMAAQYHDIDLDFQREPVTASDYNVHLIYGSVNVKEDLKAALDKERVMFSLSETPLYGQP
jgi:hypothetical protein